LPRSGVTQEIALVASHTVRQHIRLIRSHGQARIRGVAPKTVDRCRKAAALRTGFKSKDIALLLPRGRDC
jgi:hypothetical protein